MNTSDDIRQGAKLYMFRGSEADNDQAPITIGMPRSYSDDRRRCDVVPEPMSDDERDFMVADDATDADPFESSFQRSFARQAKLQSDMSWKWANRCIAVIGAGTLFWVAYTSGLITALLGAHWWPR